MAGINPFQAPINYAVEVQSPFEAALGGFKLGAAGAEAQAQAQAREQAMRAQTELKTLFSNPNATATDFARVSAMLPKDQAENVRKSFDLMSSSQQQNRLAQSGQVYAAMKSGQTDIAKNLLKEQADAFRNSGREQDAKATETYLQLIDVNPTGAQTTIGLMMATLPGGKELLENVDKTLSTGREEAKAPAALTEARAKADKAVADATTAQATATNAADRAKADADKAVADANAAKVKAKYAEQVEIAGLNKTNWDINNLRSQIGDRSARLNLDTQKTAADVAEKMSSIQSKLNDIPSDTRKLINESATLAATSKQSAEQFNDLAKRLDESGGGYGVFSSASDFLKKGAGFQGGMTQLRQEYTRLRNTAAIKSLPPGPATDKDIAMALKGFPSDNASAGDLSSFLRGMAKLQDVDASVNNAKTDWLAQNNGTLTRAKNTFVAGDYATKPGETFNDFAQRIVVDVSKKYRSPEQMAEDRRQQLVSQIPTNQAQVPAAAAAAAPANIRSQADAILRGGQ
jgi:hypothetical protein